MTGPGQPTMARLRFLFLEHDVSGGTETLCRHLLPEFAALAGLVVVACPRYRLDHWHAILPASDHLRYASFEWGESGPEWLVARLAGLIHRGQLRATNRRGPAAAALRRLGRLLFDARLRHLVRRHRLRHCLVPWILGQTPPRLPCPVSIMFQDLNYRLSAASRHPLGASLEELDRAYRRWFAAARWIFPISNEAGRELLAFAPELAAKTRPVPLGSSGGTRTPPPAAGFGDPPAELRDWPPGPLFYYPANVYPHKNHLLLLRAFAQLVAGGADIYLLLTGLDTDRIVNAPPTGTTSPLPPPPPTIAAAHDFWAAHEPLFRGRLRALGRLPAAQVDHCYRAAAAVILPSHYEGFGLPLLEAIEHRKPILCSDLPVFREQLDRYRFGGAIACPPNDLPALVAGWRQLIAELAKPAGGNLARAAAAADLGRWTWHHAAHAYLATMTGGATPAPPPA